jgi:hypothetical protein
MRWTRPLALVTAAAAALAFPTLAGASTKIGLSSPAPGQLMTTATGPSVWAQLSTSDPALSYRVPSGGGVITSWTVWTKADEPATAPYTLELLTPAAGGDYVVSARDTQQITTAAGGIAVGSTVPTRIGAAGGELLGVWAGDNGSLAVPLTTSDDDAAGLDSNQPTDPALQSTVHFISTPLTKRRLLLGAVLEPDADRDVYGDESQDACPGDATAHVAPCPVAPPNLNPLHPPTTNTTPDKTSPRLSAGAHSARLSRSGAIAFRLTSTENATGTATGTISLPKGAKVVRFKRAGVRLTANRTVTIRLKLSKKDAARVRRALGRHSRLKARITLAAHDGAGNAATKRLSLKLAR